MNNKGVNTMPKDNFILSKFVKKNGGFSSHTGYGLNYSVPRGAYGVILAGNRGGGLIPFRYLLPHQVYQETIQKAFGEYNFDTLYAIPARAHEPVLLAARDQKTLDKWEGYENSSGAQFFKWSGDLKSDVEKVAEAALDVAQTATMVEEFMIGLDRHIHEEVQKAVRARDEEWQKKINNVAAGMKYI